MTDGLSYVVIVVMCLMAFRERYVHGKYNGWFWVFLAAATFNILSLVK